MSSTNLLNRITNVVSVLPRPIRPAVFSTILGRVVPFVGTAGLRVEEMSKQRVVISTKNRRRVHNHIKGVHAAAMALIAETATGFVVGMNLPSNKLPLIKTLKVDFKKRTLGDMRAIATITDQQRRLMETEEKGNVAVPVIVEDESHEPPIECEMIWAWVPKKKQNGSTNPR